MSSENFFGFNNRYIFNKDMQRQSTIQSPLFYFELLDINQTINCDLCPQQIQRPASANQTGLILLYNNGRPHVTQLIQQKIERLEWEVLLHLPWSPDLAPSEHHLFVTAFFESELSNSYKRGIEVWPER